MKGIRALVCAPLAIVLATAAVPNLVSAADIKFSGFLRSRGIIADHSFGKDTRPDKLVDNRFRGKIDWSANEYISGTYLAEIDFQAGDGSKAVGRNEGGGLGADTVNIETKNLYMDVKVRDQPLSTRIGLQTVVSGLHQQVILGDAWGVLGMGKWDPVDVTVGWFKLDEGDDGANNSPGRSFQEDDVDMWLARLGYAPDPNLKIGFDLYYFINQGNPSTVPPREIVKSLAVIDRLGPISFRKERTFFMGPEATFRLPWAVLSGYFAYNHGEAQDAVLLTGETTDVDIRAYNFGAKADFKVGPVGSGVELFYWSSDDDLTNSKQTFYHNPLWSINSSTHSVIPSGREGLMILLGDLYSTTYPGGPGGREITGRAHADGGFTAFGMTGIVVNGTYSPPANENVYLRGAVGYFRTLEDEVKVTDTVTVKREGKNMGTEIALRLGYKYTKNFDISLNGAYAFLGDFYEKTASHARKATPYYSSSPGDSDPDNPYVGYVMAQYSW